MDTLSGATPCLRRLSTRPFAQLRTFGLLRAPKALALAGFAFSARTREDRAQHSSPDEASRLLLHGICGELCRRTRARTRRVGTPLTSGRCASLRDFDQPWGLFSHDEDTRPDGARNGLARRKVADHCGAVPHLFASRAPGLAIQGAEHVLNSAATPEGLEIGRAQDCRPRPQAYLPPFT